MGWPAHHLGWTRLDLRLGGLGRNRASDNPQNTPNTPPKCHFLPIFEHSFFQKILTLWPKIFGQDPKWGWLEGVSSPPPPPRVVLWLGWIRIGADCSSPPGGFAKPQRDVWPAEAESHALQPVHHHFHCWWGRFSITPISPPTHYTFFYLLVAVWILFLAEFILFSHAAEFCTPIFFVNVTTNDGKDKSEDEAEDREHEEDLGEEGKRFVSQLIFPILSWQISFKFGCNFNSV